jgi:fructose-1-phosphate kinase PfkB-like protein
MRAFLFLNLSRALTGSLTSPNAWDVNRVEVSRNAPSDNALPSDKLYDALNARSRKVANVIISLWKDSLVAGFTYTVSQSESDHERVGI